MVMSFAQPGFNNTKATGNLTKFPNMNWGLGPSAGGDDPRGLIYQSDTTRPPATSADLTTPTNTPTPVSPVAEGQTNQTNTPTGIVAPEITTPDKFEAGEIAPLPGVTSSYADPTQNSPLASEQLTGLLTSGNPYIEAAKLQGEQYAQSRGLLNTTLGAEAAQKAMVEAAAPIAAQDAGFAAGLLTDREQANLEMTVSNEQIETASNADLTKMVLDGTIDIKQLLLSGEISKDTATTLAFMDMLLTIPTLGLEGAAATSILDYGAELANTTPPSGDGTPGSGLLVGESTELGETKYASVGQFLTNESGWKTASDEPKWSSSSRAKLMGYKKSPLSKDEYKNDRGDMGKMIEVFGQADNARAAYKAYYGTNATDTQLREFIKAAIK